jgi:hypothetical protein
MKARISFPIVVMGPIYNGTTEHPALITRLMGDRDADTVDGPVVVNAVLFPDGGGDPQTQTAVHLYDTRDLAVAAGTKHRVAYWAANS